MQNSLTKKQHQTIATFDKDEVWIVSTGKQEFILNGKEAEALKKETATGKRGLVWFRDFAISIPHITHIYRKKDSNKKIDNKRAEFAKRFGF